jgi:SAM-dependent methyltransferase
MDAPTIRHRVSWPFLSGRGLEIGAGVSPQRLPEGVECVYFDKNDAATLSKIFGTEIGYIVHPMSTIEELFAHGADFVIAHNVLEHSHCEIACLIDWHRHVKDGGVVVLSVPDKRFTSGDSERPSAGFEHILADFLLCREEDCLEAREHLFSFCIGWTHANRVEEWRLMGKAEFLEHMLRETRRNGHDFHWHAIERDVWDRIIAAACHFGRKRAEVLAVVDPTSTAELRPENEIVYVYRLTSSGRSSGFPDIRTDLEAFGDRLAEATARLSCARSKWPFRLPRATVGRRR